MYTYLRGGWSFLLAIIGCADGDDCHVIGDEACSENCVPVISSSTGFNQPCTKDGVFFGCVPEPGSDFWETSDVQIDQDGVCDLLVGEEPAYFYCFEGRFNVYWYYKHLSRFCQGECSVEPVTVCPPE